MRAVPIFLGVSTLFATAVITLAGETGTAATRSPTAACPKGSVAAVVVRRHVCLKAGLACVRGYDAQYRRYGFACGTGRLTRPWLIRDLGDVGGMLSSADINESGQIVGSVQGHRPFLWQKGTLTTLGARAGQANAINGNGAVVGWTYTATGAAHAFLWRRGSMTDLGTLGGATSAAAAINARGRVIGKSQTAIGTTHAFLWYDGKMTDLGTLGGGESTANAINDRGQIVGDSETTTGELHGFLWDNGTLTDLGDEACTQAINESTQILGYNCDDGAALFWEKGQLAYLPYFPGQEWGVGASAINDRGEIVGGAVAGVSANGQDDVVHAFVLGNGHMTDLGRLTGDNSWAAAINERGQIAGNAEVAPPYALGPGEEAVFEHAFSWQKGKMTDLGTLGGYNSNVLAMNDHNQIVGWSATAKGRIHLVLWTPRGGG